MRQLYAEVVRLFNSSHSIAVIAGVHEDMRYRNDALNFTVNFKWIPFVDGELRKVVEDELFAVRHGSSLDLALLSSAVWTIRYHGDTVEAFDEYFR